MTKDHNEDSVYAFIANGDMTGIPLLENEERQHILPFFRPRNLEELKAFLVLCFWDEINWNPEAKLAFANKRPLKNIPIVNDVLNRTYGQLMYRTQVEEIVQIVMGCTSTEARYFVKKKLNVHGCTESDKQCFIEKFLQNNIVSLRDAQECFELLERRAATAVIEEYYEHLAILAYRGAWWKLHFPDGFAEAKFAIGLGEEIVRWREEIR